MPATSSNFTLGRVSSEVRAFVARPKFMVRPLAPFIWFMKYTNAMTTRMVGTTVMRTDCKKSLDEVSMENFVSGCFAISSCRLSAPT